MAKNRTVGCVTALLTALAGVSLLPAALADTVGAIPAHFSVTPAGAATYAIPIALPTGINGLTPHLGLAYSSASGNGLAGFGWTLTGFSAITRCAKTIVEDGEAAAVTLGAQDSFCLDGNKLRLVSGTYGAEGATYRTEREQFFRITSHTSGGAGPQPTTGPQWFTVETPSGLTYEYGKTADSEIMGVYGVRVWALDKITDTNGNFILFQYVNDNASHSYRPSKVTYTGHGSLTPAHTIIFGYEPLPSGADPIDRYVGGIFIRRTQRLQTITVNYGDSPVHTYTLAYETSEPTHRSRLRATVKSGV